MPKGCDDLSDEDAERLIARLIVEEADRRGLRYEDRTGNGADDGADVMVSEPDRLHIYGIGRHHRLPRRGSLVVAVRASGRGAGRAV